MTALWQISKHGNHAEKKINFDLRNLYLAALGDTKKNKGLNSEHFAASYGGLNKRNTQNVSTQAYPRTRTYRSLGAPVCNAVSHGRLSLFLSYSQTYAIFCVYAPPLWDRPPATLSAAFIVQRCSTVSNTYFKIIDSLCIW